jgi:hypothetical protein
MIIAAVALVAFALPVSADEVFELPSWDRGFDPTWPPDGVSWHTLHPPEAYCTNAVQTDHDDVDGDGNISFCDNIQIDDVWKHIEWCGPTFTLVYVGGGRQNKYVEPIEGDGRQFTYHEVYPTYCNIITTTEPIDGTSRRSKRTSGPTAAVPWIRARGARSRTSSGTCSRNGDCHRNTRLD